MIRMPEKGSEDEVTALLARVCDGDAEAFADLVGLHSGLVRGVAIRTLGPQDAQDACQDVWLRVWLSPGMFRAESSFATWLYRVALNTCLTELKRASRRRFREAFEETDGQRERTLPGDPAEDPGSVIAEGERRREARVRVREALSGMREDHRAALLLRHADGLSYPEVAEALGVPSGTAKGWVHRAKVKAAAISPIGAAGDPTPRQTASLAGRNLRVAG